MVFRNQYWFLSNFYPCKIRINGYEFKNAESAFQSFKDSSRQSEFQNLTGAEAKSLGRRVHLRSDWNAIRLYVMRSVLEAKFSDPELMRRLRETAPSYIVEDNTWNDTYWGRCRGKGQNNLGKLLMEIRDR